VIKLTFDKVCRGLFFLLLLVWVIIYLYKIFNFPSQTSIIITLVVLILFFTFFVGFFEILESFVIKFLGVEFSGKVRDRNKIETEVLFRDIAPYRFIPSGTEIDVSPKEIDEGTLSILKKIYDIVEEEK
jgi:hypothetical protein